MNDILKGRSAFAVAARAAVTILDALFLVVSAWVAVVLATGGWEWTTPFGSFRAHTASNAIYLLAALGAVRFALRHSIPRFLGVYDLRELPEISAVFLAGTRRWLQQPSQARAARLLALFIVCSTAIKVLNAYHYYGFCCGDDVEIHEMTFAKLFGWHWTAWEIRNALYPMVFIYPVQAVLVRFRVMDPGLLILAGRLVVVGCAAVGVWLTYRLAARICHSRPIGILAALLLGLSKLYTTFGSSELPGAVASVFMVASCLLILENGGRLRLTAAAILMAFGASLRFSELVFVAPAVLSLLLERRFCQALAFTLLTGASVVLVVGLADLLYVGEPLASLVHVIDFTLVKGLSTRGLEPFHYYLSAGAAWSDYFMLGFMVCGLRRCPLRLSVWFLLPFLALSCLPHKEVRYLVPAMPFAAVLASIGIWRLLEEVSDTSIDTDRRRNWPLALVSALVVMVLLEMDGARFRRSESAIDAARYVARQNAVEAVALEQSWQAGGRLYLSHVPNLLDVSPDTAAHPAALSALLTSRHVDYLGLNHQTVERLGYERLLRRIGYEEVHFGGRTARQYRLFSRAGRRDGEARSVEKQLAASSRAG